MHDQTTLTVRHQTGKYEVVVGSGLLDSLPEHIQAINASGPIGIVTNNTVNQIFGEQVRQVLRGAGFVTRTILIPDGEEFKTLASAEQVISALIAQGIERSGTIITLGGGVITDLGGFVASILYRGVTLVHLPTTLLSMVDAAVGGKTGVNHAQGKNLIGSFYQPDLVLMDVDTLSSLDRRDRVSGFAEMLKMGAIMDPEYLDQLVEGMDAFIDGPADGHLAKVIAHSVALKAKVVEADEKESDLRRILNFGHTIGHAVESTLGYGVIRHGEAVVLGMYAAGWLSNQLAGLDDAAWQKLSSALVRIPIDAPIQDLDSNAIEQATRLDKKVANSQLHFVLLNEIGKTQMQAGIPILMIKLAVDAIKKAWKGNE
jgi:3-dehydroquinate synthase